MKFTFLEILIHLRKRRVLTQLKVAESCNLSQNEISLLENGKIRFHSKILAKYLKAIDNEEPLTFSEKRTFFELWVRELMKPIKEKFNGDFLEFNFKEE